MFGTSLLLTLFNRVGQTFIGLSITQYIVSRLSLSTFFFYLKKHADKPLVLPTDMNLAKRAQRIQRSRINEFLVWSTQLRHIISP
jgi:hypothetical protein